MRKSMIMTAALLTCAATADAAPWEKSGIDWAKPPVTAADNAWAPPKPVRLALANGMALLVLENHALPLFQAELVIPGAGSSADPDGKEGLAAFTADLLDEGAGGLTALELADQIDRLGANIEPYAERDNALIECGGLVKTLDPTLELFAKVLTSPSFDEKEGTRVHDDRQTSLELRKDRPREVASLLLSEMVWGRKSAYGHAGGGYAAGFKGITVADARALYQSYYDPSKMTLVVAGDVDAQKLKERLDASIGKWKPDKLAKQEPPKVAPAKITSRLVLVDRKGAEQSDVRIGTVGILETDRRYPTVEVLDTILGGSFTSRLNHRLREELGFTYGIRGGELYSRFAGTFQISTALVTAHTDEGLVEIVKILGELGKKLVPADELAKAKQNLIRQMPQQFDTNSAMVHSFAGLVMDGLPDDFYTTYAARIGKVTAKDVRDVAATLYANKSMVFVIVGDMSVVKKGLDTLKLGTPAIYQADGSP
jgi:predicted Zn-dependent peptidase